MECFKYFEEYLRFWGVWPFPNKSKITIASQIIPTVLVLWITSTNCAVSIKYLQEHGYSESALQMLLSNVIYISVALPYIPAHLMFFLQRKKCRPILKETGTFLHHKEKDVIKIYFLMSKYALNVVFYTWIIVIPLKCILARPSLKVAVGGTFNTEFNDTISCYGSTPTLQGYCFAIDVILFIALDLCMWYMTNVGICLGLLYVYCSELFGVRVDFLTKTVVGIKFSPDDAHSSKLHFCIEYHAYISDLFHNFLVIFNPLTLPAMLATVFGATLLLGICFILPGIAAVSYASLLISILLFAYHFGQRLIDKGDALSRAIYDTNWYEANPKVQKEVLLFLLKAQMELQVRSAAMGRLSHEDLKAAASKLYVWTTTFRNLL